MTAWCILRCSNGKTLDLVASLNEAGFEAWSPVDDETPLTASYVFAGMDRLRDLLELARSPSLLYRVWDKELRKMVTKGHAPFRVMPDPFTTWATVSDAQLAPIRAIEYKRSRKPRGTVKSIPIGTKVRLFDGGFAGMNGTVQEIRGKSAMVVFEGFPVPVQIGCWLLTEMLDERASVNVNTAPSERAAKAA